jgi:hypothetical protein
MTGKITIEQKWHQQSEAAKDEAEKLPHGKERDALVRKARQLLPRKSTNGSHRQGYSRRSKAASVDGSRRCGLGPRSRR